jgi:hypothetical protein
MGNMERFSIEQNPGPAPFILGHVPSLSAEDYYMNPDQYTEELDRAVAEVNRLDGLAQIERLEQQFQLES